jgi:peptidoglycan/LPS O-acetylase OafA/YrhL
VKPHYLHAYGVQPPMFWAAVTFVLLVVLMSSGHLSALCNKAIRRLGVLSFSMYMLHIAAIDLCTPLVLRALGEHAEGMRAIGVFGVLWLVVVASTAVASSLTHLWIEEPGNRLGRRLIDHLRSR